MPDTSFGWKSEAAFLASMGAKSVLPQKVIRVDDASPSHAAELMSGELYVVDSITRQAVIAKEPRMACPHCGQLVSGLAEAVLQYEIPQTNAPCLPLGDNTVEPPRMIYSLEPCMCRASQEWAAAFSAELNRRMEGGEPRPIIDMTEKERQGRIKNLEELISKLYSAQAKATMPEHKDAIQYRLVILTDQLMRLIPGSHNKVPPVKLNPNVEQWASIKGYHKPPQPVEVQALNQSLFKWPGLPQNPPPPSKGVCVDPATNLVYDESGQVPMPKPGEDTGYGSAYPMPKNFGSGKPPAAQPQKITKPLGSVPVPPGKVIEDQGTASALNEKLTQLQGLAHKVLQKRNMHPVNSPPWNEYQQQYVQLLGTLKATENQLVAMPSAFSTYKPLAKVAENVQAQAAQQLQQADEQHKKTLSSIIDNTSIEELITIFGADKFQLPKQWLTHLLNLITVNKPLFTEVIKKITGSTNLANLATRSVFIEKNLRNHRDKGESLAPLTVQFLAVMCKTMVNLGPVVMDGPSAKPVAGSEQSPVQTNEQFHDQFKRKRRKIRKMED